MSVTSITDTKQYLTFRLGEEIFAVDVSHVREILEFTTVTKVPKTPDYMTGVINLRGSVVPVLDMRPSSASPGRKRRSIPASSSWKYFLKTRVR